MAEFFQDTELFRDRKFSQTRGRKLLTLWILRAHKSARAHYKQAAILKTGDKSLTILNAGLSIVILYLTTMRLDSVHHRNPDISVSLNARNTVDNSAQGAELTSIDSAFSKIDLIAVFALFLVLTTIFQFILQWGQRRLQHKYAASEFSNFQRKAERYSLNDILEMGAIHNLNREYNHITKSYGMVHPAIWRSVGGDVDYTIHCIESGLRDVTPRPAKKLKKIPLRWRFIFWLCAT